MMSSFEVVDNLLRNKPADRVGVMDGPWAETIAAWVQQGYPTRMVDKEIGERFWRPDDGRWDDVEVEAQLLEKRPTTWRGRGKHQPHTSPPLRMTVLGCLRDSTSLVGSASSSTALAGVPRSNLYGLPVAMKPAREMASTAWVAVSPASASLTASSATSAADPMRSVPGRI